MNPHECLGCRLMQESAETEAVETNNAGEGKTNDVCEPCKKIDEALDDLEKEGEELFRYLTRD